MKGLTRRQRQVLEFILDKLDSGSLIPTYREMADHFGFSSPNAVLIHIKALRSKGYLQNQPGRARSLQVLDPHAPKLRVRPRIASIPIYGTIPAGYPMDTDQEDEGCVLIDIDTLGIKPTARTFGLKVQGNSMLGKFIMSGDIAILEHGLEPRSGDVVAALIDGQVTLKTFFVQQGKPFLRAENPHYPNLIPREELQIQGVMVALIRKRQ